MPENLKKSASKLNFPFSSVTITEKLVFARHLAVMLRSGLSIIEALNIIHDQSSGKLQKVLQEVIETVQSGNPLSEALKKYPKIFSNFFVSAVYTGEVSGTLEKNLSNIAKHLESEKELKEKIRGAMIYPLIVIAAAFFLGVIMTFLVLPKITPLFASFDMELPLATRILIWVSDTVQENGVIIFWSLIAAVIILPWFLRQNFFKPISHFIVLNMPIIRGVSRNSNLSGFSKNLAILLKSGLPIDQALEIIKDTSSNYYYRKCISKISPCVAQGSRLSENLEKFEKYFPKLMISMVGVGERSGNLEESLFYLAEFYEIEVDNATKTLSTAIEPILLVGIGLLVGGMALAIVTPIYQITGGIHR